MKPDAGNHQPSIVILTGPTGSGKTALAVSLSRLPGMPSMEIISADSRQVYRNLNIGTDKVARHIRESIPHHMIDIIDPDNCYSVAEFVADADPCIRRIHSRKKLPLVVGGTGLYIRALTGGLADVAGPDRQNRDTYKHFLQEFGPDALHQLLEKRDSHRAVSIHPTDSFRVIRALEILDAGTESVSQALREHGFTEQPYRFLKYVLSVDRQKLYKKIDGRVDGMITRGWIDEVAELTKIYGKEAPALSGIGYSQIRRYLDGEIPLNEAIRIIKRDTRHYAKRQITWFRKEPGAQIIPHDPDCPDKTIQYLAERIRRFYECANTF